MEKGREAPLVIPKVGTLIRFGWALACMVQHMGRVGVVAKPQSLEGTPARVCCKVNSGLGDVDHLDGLHREGVLVVHLAEVRPLLRYDAPRAVAPTTNPAPHLCSIALHSAGRWCSPLTPLLCPWLKKSLGFCSRRPPKFFGRQVLVTLPNHAI